MEPQRPKFTITRRKESLTVTIHGNEFDQSICFNCYGGTHRSVFNNFADELMQQNRLDVSRIYGIAKTYNRKHVNSMGVTSPSRVRSEKAICKIIF